MFGFLQKKSADRGTASPLLDTTSTLRRAPHVVSTTHGEETVLLDVKGGRYHTLNDVGTRAWQLLATGITVDALVEAIGDEYELPPGVPPGQIERDVHGLLAILVNAGLVV